MDICFGPLEVTGDFTLRNIRELGFDRDFILLLPRPVLELKLGEGTLQLVRCTRLLLRASLNVPEVTCHFLAEEDVQSAVANYTFRADQMTLELEEADGKTRLRLTPRSGDRTDQ